MIYFGMIGAFAMSWLLTLWLRRYALAKRVLDVPNERSSHSIPTPRGGGLSIVIAVSIGLAMLLVMRSDSIDAWIAYLGAGIGVAAIGFADDHGHIAARWRLLGHTIASAWVVYWLNGLAPLSIGGIDLPLGGIGCLLAILYLIWMLNLYNFMDGIDGLASVQAITSCAGACLVYGLTDNLGLIALPLLIASAVAGFTLWNFPVAKIFMGDAGSGFLGILLGAMALEAAWVSQDLFWAWMILLGVFIVDASWTLGHRMLRKQRVYEGHRSHAYQFAARRYRSHKKVTLAVAVINCLWLMPVAIGVALDVLSAGKGLMIAYAPLLVLALFFNAGGAEAGRE